MTIPDEEITFPDSTWRDVELAAWGSLGYDGTAAIGTEWAVMTSRELIPCENKAAAEEVAAAGGRVVCRTVVHSDWYSDNPPEYIITPRAAEERDRQAAEVDRLNAIIVRLAMLHTPAGEYCTGCSEAGPRVEWPCRTVNLLKGNKSE